MTDDPKEMNDSAIGVKVYLTEELNLSLKDSKGFDPSNLRAISVKKALKLLEKVWK